MAYLRRGWGLDDNGDGTGAAEPTLDVAAVAGDRIVLALSVRSDVDTGAPPAGHTWTLVHDDATTGANPDLRLKVWETIAAGGETSFLIGSLSGKAVGGVIAIYDDGGGTLELDQEGSVNVDNAGTGANTATTPALTAAGFLVSFLANENIPGTTVSGDVTEIGRDNSTGGANSTRNRLTVADGTAGDAAAKSATYTLSASGFDVLVWLGNYIVPAGGFPTQEIDPDLLGGSSQFNPTVTPGSVTATPGLLGTATLHAPTLLAGSVAVAPALLGGASVFSPTFTVGGVTITPALLGGASVLDPTVVPAGEAILADLLGGAQLFDPTVAAGQVTVQTELLGTGVLFDPSVIGAQSIVADVLGGASLFDPSVVAGSVALSTNLLGGATLFAPSLSVGSVTIPVELLGGATLFAPSGFLSTENIPGTIAVEFTQLNTVSVGHAVVSASTEVALGGSEATVELGGSVLIYHSEDG